MTRNFFAFVALVALCLASASAQTEGSMGNSSAGRYVTRMLEYARTTVVACPAEVKSKLLMPLAENYVCVRDKDEILFADDVTVYLSHNREAIGRFVPWTHIGQGTHMAFLDFAGGYKLTLMTNGDFAFLQGRFGR